KAGRAADRFLGQPMLGLVEPGGRKLGDEQSQPLHLLWGDNAVEQFVEVGLRDLLAARYVAKVWAGGQEQGRWELGQVRFRDVEIDIEALVFRVVSQPHLREQLMAVRLQGVGQRPKAEREQIVFADFVGTKTSQLFPAAEAVGQT